MFGARVRHTRPPQETDVMTNAEKYEVEESICDQGPDEQKIVIRLSSGIAIKGYAKLGQAIDLHQLWTDSSAHGDRSICLRSLEDGTMMDVPLRDAKAVFVVKSFRGDARRKGVRFYANGPVVGQLWAEVRFHDNEVMEGTVENSADHLLGNFLLLHPSDEEGNNIFVCVNKAAIAGYRVLGILPHKKSDE